MKTLLTDRLLSAAIDYKEPTHPYLSGHLRYYSRNPQSPPRGLLNALTGDSITFRLDVQLRIYVHQPVIDALSGVGIERSRPIGLPLWSLSQASVISSLSDLLQKRP